MPRFTSDPKQPLAEPVGGFPEAASWAGIEDLVGSVYQWTDVFSDDHTSRYELNSTLQCIVSLLVVRKLVVCLSIFIAQL